MIALCSTAQGAGITPCAVSWEGLVLRVEFPQLWLHVMTYVTQLIKRR